MSLLISMLLDGAIWASFPLRFIKKYNLQDSELNSTWILMESLFLAFRGQEYKGKANLYDFYHNSKFQRFLSVEKRGNFKL